MDGGGAVAGDTVVNEIFLPATTYSYNLTGLRNTAFYKVGYRVRSAVGLSPYVAPGGKMFHVGGVPDAPRNLRMDWSDGNRMTIKMDKWNYNYRGAQHQPEYHIYITTY